MIITCSLAGCATFSINKVKYYNETVATVGDTHITRYDLLSAYNSYGSTYYVQQQGQSESEAMASTLDLLVDRELMYQYAVENKATYGLTPYQVNTAIKTVFESFDEQMASYVTEAKKIYNIDIVEEDEDDEEEETAYKYDDYAYSPRAVIKHDDNGYYIDYIEEDEPSFSAIIAENYLNNYESDETLTAIIDAYFEHFKKTLVNETTDNQTLIYNKAISLLADDLIEYEYYLRDENGKKYSTKTNELIERYFKRNYESQLKSQYLENIRVEYLKNETLSIDLLKSEFVDSVEYSYAKYKNHTDSYKSEIKSISTNGDTILYHPSLSDGTKFGYFVHTLLSFSDKQKSDIETLEKNKNSMSQDKYQLEYNKIVLQTIVNERDLETGLETDNARSLSYILSEYNKIANSDDTLSAFIEFMFRFTGDTATLSAGMPYVVGNNGYSDMEEAFTNECVRLLDGDAGDMSVITDYSDIESDLSNSENASNVDSLEDYGFVITSYGIHLVYYVDEISAFDVPYTSIDAVYFADDNNSNLNLYYKEINPLTHETYFDMLFDTVYPATSDEDSYTSNNGYTDYEENLVDSMQNRVTINKTKLKSTKTSI